VREYELRHGIAEQTSAWPSGERKCPSEPSTIAERKTNRWKEKALRNAYRTFPRALRSMYDVGVCAYCGMLHNVDFNLCGMVFECADRL